MLSQPSLKLCAYIIRRSHPPPPPSLSLPRIEPRQMIPRERKRQRRGEGAAAHHLLLFSDLTWQQAPIMRQRGMRQRFLPETRMLTRKWTVLNWQIMGLLWAGLRQIIVQTSSTVFWDSSECSTSNMWPSTVLFFPFTSLNLWIECGWVVWWDAVQ